MPLLKGKSKSTISKNIKELMDTKPGKTRAKGIATIAKSRGITKRKAEQIQSVAISLNKAGKSKKQKIKRTVDKYLKKVTGK